MAAQFSDTFDSQINKTNAAYHEAGHAVMAASVGQRPARVMLRRPKSTQNWVGHTICASNPAIDRSHVNPKSAIIAVAGPFAQAKHIGTQSFGAGSFAPILGRQDLLSSFLLDESAAPGRITLDYIVQSSGCVKHVPVDPDWFSREDLRGFSTGLTLAQVDSPGSLALILLQQVIETLDDARQWEAIERIASELVRRATDSDGLIELSGAELERLLPSEQPACCPA